MITAGDVQYEPNQQKMAFLTPTVALVIAGDYTVHSQAIRSVMKACHANPNVTVHQAATMYGQAIQVVQRKAAEDLILAPLGLNTDMFLGQQKDFSEGFIASQTEKLQAFEGANVEALVVGVEGNTAHIYEIDRRGSIYCYDDVGFAAIGIGAYHARSSLMQVRFMNNWNYVPAIAATFAAKKAAETAPGVGTFTDINLVYRTGIERLRQQVADQAEIIYKDFAEKRLMLSFDAATKLADFIRDLPPDSTPDAKESSQGQHAIAYAGDNQAEGPSAPEGAEDETKAAE